MKNNLILFFITSVILCFVSQPALACSGHDHEHGENPCPRCGGHGSCYPPSNASPSQYQFYCFGSKKCGVCNGDGKRFVNGEEIQCITCKGKGKCTACNGTGECPRCHGTGKVPDGLSGSSDSSSNYSSGYSSDYSSGSSYSSGSGGGSSAFGDMWDTMAMMDPMVLTAAIAIGAVLSYGIYGYMAVKSWNEYSFEYPNLQARAGYSVLYGFNASVKSHFGGTGGLVLDAGVGTGKPGSSAGAFIGAGFYLCPTDACDISWTWELGSVWKCPCISSIAEFSYFFGVERKHGAFVGLGLGYADDVVGEIRLGYTYKIMNW